MNFQQTKLWLLGSSALAGLLLVGCLSGARSEKAKGKAMLIEVWTQTGWPPEDMPAPPPFAITPQEAYQWVARAKKLPLKHRWACYRDSKYYYIADTFGRVIRAGNIRKHAVRVHGTTGDLE